MDHRPSLGNILGPPTIRLRTMTSHQERLFQRKIPPQSLMLRQEHTDWSDPYSIYNIQVDTVFTIRLAWGKKKISEVEVSPQTTSKKKETQSSTNNGIPPEGTALHGFLHNQKHTQSQTCSSHQLPHFLDISSSCNTLLYL